MDIKGSLELERVNAWGVLSSFIRLKTTRRPILYLFLMNKQLYFLLDKLSILQHNKRLKEEDLIVNLDSGSLQLLHWSRLLEKQWNLEGVFTFADENLVRIDDKTIFVSARLLQTIFPFSKSTLYYCLNVLKSGKSVEGVPFNIFVEREFPRSKNRFYSLQKDFYEVLDDNNIQLSGALEHIILLELQLSYYKDNLSQLTPIIESQHKLIFDAAKTIRKSSEILKDSNYDELTRVKDLKERVEPVVTFVRFLNKHCRKLVKELDHLLENFDNIKSGQEFDNYYIGIRRRIYSALNVEFLDFMQRFIDKKKKTRNKYIETFCTNLQELITGNNPVIVVLEKICESIGTLLYTEEAREELHVTESEIIGLENLLSELL
ncbi:MAG: hypothetical protein ACXAEU_21570 [Candidatus Hodarchaeales archaeon]